MKDGIAGIKERLEARRDVSNYPKAFGFSDSDFRAAFASMISDTYSLLSSLEEAQFIALEFEFERDAALETLRLVRLSQSVNKADVIKAETQREYADARVLRMVEEMGEARRGEALALERVRVLEPILEAALNMDTKTQNHWAALESGDPELLKPEVRSQSYAQMITAENKVFDLIKPFREIESQP